MGIFDFFKKKQKEVIKKETTENAIKLELFPSGKIKSEIKLNKDGEPEGLIKHYYENGQIEEEANYKNGKREGLSKSYFENGQLKEETTDENDKREGISKTYYENGQLKSEINYINGKPEGLIKYFHENGQIEEESNYKNGERDGFAKIYLSNGKLEVEANFKDGEKLETIYEDTSLMKWSNTHIDQGIKTTFNRIKEIPLFQNFDDITLNIWEKFIAYCYCTINIDGGGTYLDPKQFLELNPDFLNGKPTSRMIICIHNSMIYGEKYYIEHVEEFLNDFEETDDAYDKVETEMNILISGIDTKIFDVLYDLKTDSEISNPDMDEAEEFNKVVDLLNKLNL
jgi:antitoxin component YwqK of YwqJK toxin-antitoxin module